MAVDAAVEQDFGSTDREYARHPWNEFKVQRVAAAELRTLPEAELN